MAQFLLLLTAALVVGAIVFGIVVLISGGDGLGTVDPDGRSVPLPVARPLVEGDLGSVRFDTALRGYRMAQVDHALRRAAYDIGYKGELIQVLEAEVAALREGRIDDADALRDARKTALNGSATDVSPGGTVTDQGSGVSLPTTRGSQTTEPAEAPAEPAEAPAALAEGGTTAHDESEERPADDPASDTRAAAAS